MNKKFIFIFILFALILTLGNVSANEINNDNVTSTDYYSSVKTSDDSVDLDNNNLNEDMLQVSSQESIQARGSSDVIVVNNWDELQYYCSLNDKNYVLKLKENTNFYPTDPSSANYQIKIKNNVKIIGSNGSYFGDISANPTKIQYTAIIVEDSIRKSLTLDNVTFKWIKTNHQPDGIFLQMGGTLTSVIKNCYFHNINTIWGHSTIVYLKKGSAIIDNCSFVNCTTDFGVIGIFDPASVKSTDMVVRNCYFENNYAKTEPGCINNCGKLTVYNTTFYKNRSYWWAGAIHTHSGGNTTIYDSNFTDNVAGWNGGALYTYSYLQIYNSVFVGNNCTTNSGGGAIGACAYGGNPHIYIENSLFKNNRNNCWASDPLSNTAGYGGAIALMDKGSLTVLNNIFIANSAAYGTAISAFDVDGYGSPDVIIVNNSFINHTRHDDVLNVRVKNTILNISNNYYYGNSIVFSCLNLTKLSDGKEQATLQINLSLATPGRYDADILNKTLFDVYVNNNYVKTVNSTVFTVDYGDYDICDVYVIPTISNRLSNAVTIISTRDYIFVSKHLGNDNNNGLSRNTPVNTIKKALELARVFQNIILMDGDYDEGNININYNVTIKGEGNATLCNSTSFTVNTNNFTLKNMNINKLNVNTFINQDNGNLVVFNCIFNDNHVEKIINGKHNIVSKSIFTNNGGVIVYNNGFTSINDSILLNNTKIIEGNTNNVSLEYNWWGDALPNLNISKYVTLNGTASVYALENNQTADVIFAFYLNNKKYLNLPNINLNITTLNGSSSENITLINSKIVYKQTSFSNSFLIAEYNDFKINMSFEFLKSNPKISLVSYDIMYGEDLIVKIKIPKDSTGNVTVNIGNISQNKVINSTVVQFTFSNLKANNYTLLVNYSGDKKYFAQEINYMVKVKKYKSTIALNISAIEVGEDINLTITTTMTSTGNITLLINNNEHTLILNNSSATYTMLKVPRGDYLIKAIYNGDDKYLESQVSKLIEVDNLNATMNISAEDITYGEVAIINIALNSDASGNITVTIDGVSNTTNVVGGMGQVLIHGLEAGINKDICVFYSGDNNYFNLTKNHTFTINKANFTFNITSGDIRIGKDAKIVIKVPPKTKGTFTIDGNVINIPFSGEVTYVVSDLKIGDYEYVAVYNGNNYNTVSNSTSFKVIEYPIPQWPNEGGNTQNTGESPYESNNNGEVAFVIPINETIVGNLAIDSNGNLYITTASKIYSYNKTSQLWCYSANYVIGNFSGVTIGRDVVISPKTGDTLYFINQSNGEKYGNSNIYQGSSLFAPIIDSNACLYIVSEYQTNSSDYKLVIVPYKLWENGGEPTLIALGGSKPLASPVVSEEIIVVLSENRFTILDAKTFKSNAIKHGNFINVRPVISNTNVVCCVLEDSIVAYKSSGTQLWKTKVTGGVGNRLILDNNRGLYHVNAGGILYRYDLGSGKESKMSDLKVTSGILIGNDGILYFASDKTFYALNPNGKILYKSYIGYKITGNPIMDKNGLIYGTTNDNEVIALTYAGLKDPKLTVTINNITQGNNAVININLDAQTTGSVSFTIGGVNYNEFVNDGKVTRTIANLGAGVYSIMVNYSGDMRFNSTSRLTTFVVKSNINVVDFVKFDGKSTFSLDLANAGGNLSVNINNNNYNANLVDGHVSITVNGLNPGSYRATVYYSGDNVYGSSSKIITFTVQKIVLSAKDLSMFYSSGVKFKVRLTQGSIPLVGKKIIININKRNYKVVTDANGYASVKISLAPKTYNVMASWGSIKVSKKVTVKSIINAKNLKFKKSAKSIKIRIALKKVDNKYLNGKQLTLKFNKKTFKVKTNKKGLATFNIKKGIYKKLKNGKKYTYQVIYEKDTAKKSIKFS